MKDDAEFSFEVGQREDGMLWTVTVTCDEKMGEQDFAAALICMAQDILEGKTSFDTAPDVISCDSH